MPARLTPLSGGAPILLDKPIVLIGRHPDCDVVIANSAKVSRRHCCVAQINDAYFVRDLGSMNGVRVNGTRVTQAVLNPNDQLAIGDVPYVFQLDAARGARPAVPASAAPKGPIAGSVPPPVTTSPPPGYPPYTGAPFPPPGYQPPGYAPPGYPPALPIQPPLGAPAYPPPAYPHFAPAVPAPSSGFNGPPSLEIPVAIDGLPGEPEPSMLAGNATHDIGPAEGRPGANPRKEDIQLKDID